MSAISIEYPGANCSRFFNPLPMLLMLIVLATVVYGAHAVIRHGTLAEEIRRCIESNGPLETWSNPLTGRSAMICQLPSGMLGLQICEGDHEVTCIPKEKVSRIEQIYQYLRNRGYMP